MFLPARRLYNLISGKRPAAQYLFPVLAADIGC
jgi:hypothetical protein